MSKARRPDPFRRKNPQYECDRCGRRAPVGERPAICQACGGYVRNIALPREWS